MLQKVKVDKWSPPPRQALGLPICLLRKSNLNVSSGISKLSSPVQVHTGVLFLFLVLFFWFWFFFGGGEGDEIGWKSSLGIGRFNSVMDTPVPGELGGDGRGWSRGTCALAQRLCRQKKGQPPCPATEEGTVSSPRAPDTPIAHTSSASRSWHGQTSPRSCGDCFLPALAPLPRPRPPPGPLAGTRITRKGTRGKSEAHARGAARKERD